jgi:hypothetical protein
MVDLQFPFFALASELVVPCVRIPLRLNFWGHEWPTRQRRLGALVQRARGFPSHSCADVIRAHGEVEGA